LSPLTIIVVTWGAAVLAEAAYVARWMVRDE
jgi:hypothetical protein